MIAGLVVGIAALRVGLLLNSGRTFIVAQGDNRAALFLAEQRIEQLMADGFPPTGWSTVEILAGLRALRPYTRLTCVNFVNDDNPTLPSGCSDCAGGTCTGNTVRVTVTVTPRPWPSP